MKRGEAHLVIVLADPERAGPLRCALQAHGVGHAAVAAQVSSIRRRLVRSDHDFVVVCVGLDEATLNRHGTALRQLLADHGCFPTPLRSVGLLDGLGLSRQAAELGCNVYVHGSDRAAEVIRLLEDDAAPQASPVGPRLRGLQWSTRGRWISGSPNLPPELASAVGIDPVPDRGREPGMAASPDPVERPGGKFGDRFGLP
jgi:hypothetical protein